MRRKYNRQVTFQQDGKKLFYAFPKMLKLRAMVLKWLGIGLNCKMCFCF